LESELLKQYGISANWRQPKKNPEILGPKGGVRMSVPRLTIPLWVRLGVPITLIIALAIGLISFLNYYNYEKTYKQLNVSRITVVARDLRQAIEAGLNVGLAPSNNTQLEKALATAQDHTEGLRFAVVIDERRTGRSRSARLRHNKTG
jgi:hypothetical protein